MGRSWTIKKAKNTVRDLEGNIVSMAQIDNDAPGVALYKAIVSLTSAQILGLAESGPIEVIPAPGPGKIIVPTYYWSLAIPGPDILWYDGTDGSVDMSIGEKTYTLGSQYLLGYEIDEPYFNHSYVDRSGVVSDVSNQPLVVKTSGTGPTGGDGSFYVEITYMIVDVP